jgi:hypothetical protein
VQPEPTLTADAPRFVRSARWLAAGVLGGFVTGAVVGGLGGRVAMFVLRLTSSPSLHGVQTDDDFTIGVFSTATLFLIGLTAFAGLLGGLVYLAIRGWLPERWRPWITGGIAGIVGGAVVIQPGGLDFTLLEPLPLAVAMFIVIPAVYGVVLSFLVERLIRDDSSLHRSSLWVLGLVLVAPIALAGPFGLSVVVLIAAIWFVRPWVPWVDTLWHSAPMTWIGRITLAAVVTFNLAALADDIQEIL